MHKLNNRKVFITGGAGFISSFLAKALLQEGAHVTLFDLGDFNTSAVNGLGLLSNPRLERINANILDKDSLLRLPKDFDYIVHAAAILGIKKVAEEPLLTANVNVIGSHNILEFAIRQKNLQRFVLFSTSEVYGVEAFNCKEEDPAIIPSVGSRWIYASSKCFSEHLLRAYIKEHKIFGTIVRPFNIYGPLRRGTNAMTALVNAALNGSDITVEGDGKQSRCWCYIEDAIDGMLKILLADYLNGEAFNLGNDSEPISILHLAEKICSLLNSPSEIKVLHNKHEDVLNRAPNINKARAILGFNPTTSLKNGIIKLSDSLKSCAYSKS